MRSVPGSRTRRRKMIVRAATCERDAPTRLCMHQFDEQSTSNRFFFWVRMESACVRVCVPMKWVDQRRGGPVLKRLWPLWWSVRPGGAEKVSADPQKQLLSMKKCTQIQGQCVSSAYPRTSTDTLLLGKESAERDEWAPAPRLAFAAWNHFYLMNSPQKMSVPCIIVYGWTLWSRQLDITHNLSFYIIYFN